MERLHRAASCAITGCLSSSPIPLLLSEASFPPLRVTLTHFTISSYERALRLQISFPISRLATLGVKLGLSRSSWISFASIHPPMLPSSSSRGDLLACPPFFHWNLPSINVELFAFHHLFPSSSCSRSDIPLSRQGAALAHPDSLLLMIWYSGQTTLFLFLLTKAAPGSFPTALSVALRPLFPFQQAQYVPVFPLKPGSFCTLFAGLGSTKKSAIFLLFSYYLTLALSLPLCPLLHLSSYLKLCGRFGRNRLFSPPVLSGYHRSPDTRFSRETTWLMSWPDGERYLHPLQSLAVSLLLITYSFLSFLELEAYCLIEILRHTGSLDFHRGTCASS